MFQKTKNIGSRQIEITTRFNYALNILLKI